MQFDLSGLRALVTGSTKGIGRAIASELAANGAEVVVNGRKAADVADTIASLQAALPKGRFRSAPGDVAVRPYKHAARFADFSQPPPVAVAVDQAAG